MRKLKITIFGNATELLIGTFPKEGANWIMEYCEELKPYTDIEEVWYGEGLKPDEWTKGKDWDAFDNIFHECGFTFCDRIEIQEFLNGDLERPAIKGVYIDGTLVKHNLSKIACNLKKIKLPSLKRNEVFVYHGSVDIVSMDYILNTKKEFLDNKLEFDFINCGEYGYMLTEIEYDGKQMKRVYSGSKINVKSGWYSLSAENKGKSISLIEPRNFLDPRFKKIRR
ncbi:MAG TPA: hypothetical protein VEK32_09565 [Thermodesulfobacteriota bacterium]|nr:hypothetical protein [Thermodesulfobacteriota bacterium]